MSNISIWEHFLFAYIATFGWSIFFNAPKKDLIICSVLGALGWVIYCFFNMEIQNSVFSNLIASSVVTLLSELFSKKFKNPTILYIIPGIIPLVPGLGIYNTMLNMVQGKYINAISIGVEVVLIAGAIVMGILVTTTIMKSIFNFKNKC